MTRRSSCAALVPLALLAFTPTLLAAPAAASPSGEGAFVDGVPRARVPGHTLLRLDGIDASGIVRPRVSDTSARKVLAESEERTGVRLKLVRPVGLGWGLYEVREPQVGGASTRPTRRAPSRSSSASPKTLP